MISRDSDLPDTHRVRSSSYGINPFSEPDERLKSLPTEGSESSSFPELDGGRVSEYAERTHPDPGSRAGAVPNRLDPDSRPVEFHYLGLGERLVDYATSDAEQRRLHALVADGILGSQLLFVEHSPVYTQGRTTSASERPQDGTQVVDVDRGGKITFHGPGQLVGYPIVFLPWKTGVVNYVRRIEEALIRLLAEFDLCAMRVPGRTGVWLPATRNLPERKIAAIGIRVSKQTSLHGFGLNISTELSYFQNIIPCGISDAGVTSLDREISEPVPTLLEIAHRLEPHFSELLQLRPYESRALEV